MTIDIRRSCVLYSGSAEPGSANHVADEVPEARTIVIFGAPRGGTTMVAGIVQRCGINIGTDLPANLEDPAFSKPADIEGMIEAIHRRNAVSNVWGWKFPRAAAYLPKVQEHLRNPRYIIVWRDILANSQRAHRRGKPLVEALMHSHKIQLQNISFLDNDTDHALLVSYEKAVLDTVATASDIAMFVGGHMPEDEIELKEFCSPGSYKSGSHERLAGC